MVLAPPKITIHLLQAHLKTRAYTHIHTHSHAFARGLNFVTRRTDLGAAD
jgi:hypothetical protein